MLDNLPDFDLEELVISYVQICHNYYLLSNSIAKRSTTVKIECELISRDINDPRKAVIQVKGGKDTTIDVQDYRTYLEKGYYLFLYSANVLNSDMNKRIIIISRDQLLNFYNEKKAYFQIR